MLVKQKNKSTKESKVLRFLVNNRNIFIASLSLGALFIPDSLGMLRFILIVIGLIVASSVLGYATEELSGYYSPSISGFINATFGNLAELIIGFFVILQGHIALVQASLTGSIIGNLLFLVGSAYLVATIKKKEISLHKEQTEVSSTMLLLSVVLLLFPSMLFIFHEEQFVKPISLAVAFALFVVYVLYLIFSFKTHKDWFTNNLTHKSTISKKMAIALMIISILILAVLSESISKNLEIVSHSLHLSDLFLGAIILGFVGNIAEHLSVVTLAKKGKPEFVLPIAIGSSLQIAMFVAPVLVFLSVLTPHFMGLNFSALEIVSIFTAVLVANEIARDKKTNWFESIQLLVLYGILAVMFFFAH